MTFTRLKRGWRAAPCGPSPPETPIYSEDRPTSPRPDRRPFDGGVNRVDRGKSGQKNRSNAGLIANSAANFGPFMPGMR